MSLVEGCLLYDTASIEFYYMLHMDVTHLKIVHTQHRTCSVHTLSTVRVLYTHSARICSVHTLYPVHVLYTHSAENIEQREPVKGL